MLILIFPSYCGFKFSSQVRLFQSAVCSGQPGSRMRPLKTRKQQQKSKLKIPKSESNFLERFAVLQKLLDTDIFVHSKFKGKINFNFLSLGKTIEK